MTHKNKPKQGTYDCEYDSRPKFVCVGVTVVSVETETIIQDGRALTLNVEDDVLYLTVPRELINDWEAIALLAEGKGYFRSHWKLQSVWECVPNHVANEIF